MTKMHHEVRKDLLRLHEVERRDLRCILTKTLHDQARELTKEIDAKIKNRKSTIDEYENERYEILKNAQFLQFNSSNYRQSCPAEEMHPDIIKFDNKTNQLRKAILLKE